MVFVDPTSFAAAPDFRVVEYFAKSCPHCVHMEPVWQQAVSAAMNGADPGTVAWAQKECYSDNWAPGPDLNVCKEAGVDSFPTIVMYKNGTNDSWVAPPLNGNTTEEKAHELLDFVNSHVETGDIKQSAFDMNSILSTMPAPQLICDNDRYMNFL